MLNWWLRRLRRDDGAAAVEFALLLPVFVMLVFGVLTGGIMLWKFIDVTQAARDASRYGSTLQIRLDPTDTNPADGLLESDWLAKVQDVAVRQAGWDPSQTPLVDNGYVCVAYVQGTATGSGTIPTMSSWTGNTPAGGAPASDQPCLSASDDPRTDDRVQVVIDRESDFNAIFFHFTPTLHSRTVIVYERPSSAAS